MKPPMDSPTLPLPLRLESSRASRRRKARQRPGKTATKPDFNDFFRHLRQDRKSAALVEFLRSIDQRACLQIAGFIERYLNKWRDNAELTKRKQRGHEAMRLSSQMITLKRSEAMLLRKASSFRMEGGSLADAGTSLRQEASPVRPDVLETEANRYAEVLAVCERLFNYKRLGVSGNHLWLVNLEEFVAAWSEQELGKSRPLRIDEIAALIRAGELAFGRKPDLITSDPELIRKALRHFCGNPANACLLSDAILKVRIQEYCNDVRNSGYYLGIKI